LATDGATRPASGGALRWWAPLAAFVALALLFRLVPALDLWVAGLFHDAGQGAAGFAPAKAGVNGAFYWLGDTGAKLAYVALSAAAVAALLGAPGLRRWRARLSFLWLALLLGPGLLVNVVLKEEVERPRPYQVVELGGPQAFVPAFAPSPPGADGASFVSGHAAIAFYLIALAWVFPQRRRRWWVVGVAFGAAMGLTRMAAGAHFLSDVVFAYFAVHATAALAAWIVARLLPPDPQP
jgi:lipid A 4'-phosphatase